jgi:hypothetical protein
MRDVRHRSYRTDGIPYQVSVEVMRSHEEMTAVEVT